MEGSSEQHEAEPRDQSMMLEQVVGSVLEVTQHAGRPPNQPVLSKVPVMWAGVRGLSVHRSAQGSPKGTLPQRHRLPQSTAMALCSQLLGSMGKLVWVYAGTNLTAPHTPGKARGPQGTE